MAVTRRGLIMGAAAGGALLVGWAIWPRSYSARLPERDGEQAFGPWLRIGRDSVVTVALPQLEMGQGVSSLLAQVAAHELGADWKLMAVEPVPPSGAFANAALAATWAPLWMPALPGLAEGDDPVLARIFAERSRLTATAQGTALAAYELPLRQTAAATREVLIKAAADRWDVGVDTCTLEGGFVRSGARKLPLGALVADAAGYALSGDPVLRADPPRERASDGAPGAVPRYPRIDGPAKARGAAIYAADVRLPGMVFAAIAHGPVGQTRLVGFDEKRIAGMSGDVKLVRGDGWVAATANTWWAADRALALLEPQFGVRDGVSSETMSERLDQAVRKDDYFRLLDEGDADGVIAGRPSLVARYDVAPALHGTLETASATARFKDGRLELWSACQAPEAARRAAARALDLRLADVVLYPVLAGGSFDARLESAHVVEAALIAREVGVPVQLTWSRWQECLAGLARPPAAAILSAKTVPGTGQIAALRTRIATVAGGSEFARRMFDGHSPRAALEASAGKRDPVALAGAIPPYVIPSLAVEHVPVTLALPAGRMRGQAHGYTAFFTESFIDELAHAARREPLSYRMEMVGGDTRLGMCLQRVSALAGWNGGNDASGQGLACHRLDDGARSGRIAVVVTARRDEAGVRVEKISVAADLGRIVNLDIARQQVEGGLIFGLGLAVGASTGWEQGLPFATRLADLGLPLLANTPPIAIDFIESDAPPADGDELAVAAIAPALANALFSATGVRFRRLPLLDDAE